MAKKLVINEQLIQNIKVVAENVTTEVIPSDKVGYNFRVTKVGSSEIMREYVKDESASVNDGSDYLKPLWYKVGDTVTEGLWYTDGEDIWDAKKSGTPESFSDTEYFNIVG